MKRLLTFMIVFAAFYVIVAATSLSPPKAQAAAPVCFIVIPPIVATVDGGNFVTLTDCSNITITNLIKISYPNGPRDDFCYAMGYTFAEKHPLDSQECRDYANDVLATADAVNDVDTSSVTNPDRDAIVNCTGGECLNDNPIVVLTKLAINFLSALIGIIITGVIMFSGFMYITSHGDPNKAAEAKTRIRNAVIALAMYMFLFAGIQWLVPGGLL